MFLCFWDSEFVLSLFFYKLVTCVTWLYQSVIQTDWSSVLYCEANVTMWYSHQISEISAWGKEYLSLCPCPLCKDHWVSYKSWGQTLLVRSIILILTEPLCCLMAINFPVLKKSCCFFSFKKPVILWWLVLHVLLIYLSSLLWRNHGCYTLLFDIYVCDT